MGRTVAILSITEAARLFGKSRTTLYKYNKSGALSFVPGDDGKPAVDMSEMLRVFGSVHGGTVHNSQNEQGNTSKLDNEHGLLAEKVAALQEVVRRQDELLRKADDREKWLQERLERSQQQIQALIHQPPEQPEALQKRKKWWPW
ncbi:hypothetical protein A4U49_00080 (plasmid) [Acidithiobacillus ferrivorans]|nr:hypothetical protein A4U49_00080 [Acidithiobacillus ferrivorans]